MPDFSKYLLVYSRLTGEAHKLAERILFQTHEDRENNLNQIVLIGWELREHAKKSNVTRDGVRYILDLLEN